MRETMSVAAAPPAAGAGGHSIEIEIVVRPVADAARAVVSVVAPAIAVSARGQLRWTIADAASAADSTDTARASNAAGTANATDTPWTTRPTYATDTPWTTRPAYATDSTGTTYAARAADATRTVAAGT
jgi:hypothetical protein